MQMFASVKLVAVCACILIAGSSSFQLVGVSQIGLSITGIVACYIYMEIKKTHARRKKKTVTFVEKNGQCDDHEMSERKSSD